MHNLLVSNNFRIFAERFCVSYVEIQMNDIKKTNLIRMMKETNIQSQVTSTIAGDDGEAMAKSEGYVAENGTENSPWRLGFLWKDVS